MNRAVRVSKRLYLHCYGSALVVPKTHLTFHLVDDVRKHGRSCGRVKSGISKKMIANTNGQERLLEHSVPFLAPSRDTSGLR